jgi:hypothetical protein
LAIKPGLLLSRCRQAPVLLVELGVTRNRNGLADQFV